jgi:hypothetical protein
MQVVKATGGMEAYLHSFLNWAVVHPTETLYIYLILR